MSFQYLYLVRHGEATSKEQNPERPLTESGANGRREAMQKPMLS